MVMNANLLNAILSMDAYNRGIDPGIEFTVPVDSVGEQIGNYIIINQSNVIETSAEVLSGFYGVAYQSMDLDGDRIIAYRGTDDNPYIDTALTLGDFSALFYRPVMITVGSIIVKLATTDVNITSDVWNGWFVGAGADQSVQALLAYEFYKDVVGGVNNVLTDDVSFTGHSLGGGLAGMVAATYGQSATVFDQMPFEKALENQWTSISDPNSPDYDSQLKEILFGNNVVTDSPSVWNHAGYSIEGEILSLARDNMVTFGLITTSTIDKSPISLGAAFDAHQASLPEVDRLTATQLHSQSLLVTRMFFSSEDFLLVVPTVVVMLDWDAASPYFWPVLYDDDFAGKIGFKNSSDDSVISGELQEQGKYSDILRGAIAYSAIEYAEKEDYETGDIIVTSATVFGDTGIRALYDDANDLGAALTAAGDDSAIEIYATDISKVFVQFAGQLALSKINQIDNILLNETAGALTYFPDNGENVLTINLTDSLWSAITNDGKVPTIVARDDLVNAILAETGIENGLRDIMDILWDDNSSDVFERVSFAVYQSLGGELYTFKDAAENKASLFLAGTKIDNLTGSEGQDMILTLRSDDTIHGSLGNDILVGGEDNDTITYEAFNHGVTISLASFIDDTGVGIVIGAIIEHELSAFEQTTYSVGDTNFPDFTDYAYEFETFVLTNCSDTVKFSTVYGFESEYVIDAGEGNNTLDFSNFDETITIDLLNNTVYADSMISADGLDLSQYVNFFGSEQNDTFVDAAGNQVYDANGGVDTIDYSAATSGIIANLSDYRIITKTLSSTGWEEDLFDDFESVIGTSGNDYFYLGDSFNGAYFDGGNNVSYIYPDGSVLTGRDVLSLLGDGHDLDGMTITLSGNGSGTAIDTQGNILSFSGIEQIIGTFYGADIITGDSSDNWLFGGGRDSDVINAKDGNDHIYAIGTLDGGAGDDTYYFDDIFNTTITDASGSYDRIYLLGNYDPTSSYWANGSISGVEYVESVDGSLFKIEGLGLEFSQDIGTPKGERIFGTDCNDALTGTNGDDFIYGYDGNDSLSGWAGDDTLNGGFGDDTLYGGADNDILYGEAGNDYLYGEEGYDCLIGGTGDKLYGGIGEDQLYALGNNVTLDGGGNNDYLSSSGENTVYIASSGTDVIKDNGSGGTLVFEGVSLSNVTFEWAANNSLVVTTLDGSKTIIQSTGMVEYMSFTDTGVIETSVAIASAGTGYVRTVLQSIDGGTAVVTDIAQTYTGGDEDNVYYSNADGDVVNSAGGANSYIFGDGEPERTITITGDIDDQKDLIRLVGITSLDDVFLVFEDNVASLYTENSQIIITNALETGASEHYRVGIDDSSEVLYYALSEVSHVIKSTNSQISGDIEGYSVDDTIYVSNMSAFVNGLTGNDLIYGGDGNNTLYGGDGDDTLYGEEGADKIEGNAGNDEIEGNAGNDEIDGGAGNDEIDGGEGADIFIDSAGNDYYKVGENDILIAGKGDNAFIMYEENLSSFTIDVSAYGLYDSNDSSTYSGVYRLLSGTGALGYILAYGDGNITMKGYKDFKETPQIYLSDEQTILLNELSIETHGTDENDYLMESFFIYQDDLVYAGGGNDHLRFFYGNDIAYGGDGNDHLSKDVFGIYLEFGTAENIGTLTAYGEAGDDFLIGSINDDYLDGGTEKDYLDGGDGNDTLYGGDGNDTLYGGEGADKIEGNAGDDEIDGGAGNDEIDGGAGNDEIDGGAGNDEIDGGTGKDYLDGGDGNDTYVWSVGDDNDIIYETSGTDQLIIHGSLASDISFELYDSVNLKIYIGAGEYIQIEEQFASDTSYQVETLVLDDGTVIDLTSEAIIVNTDNDVILTGTNQDDLLIAGVGNDTLYAYEGDDTLDGGAGNDTLHGGTGDDVYLFNIGDGVNTIVEISGHDVIQLGLGIALEDLIFNQTGNDLDIHIASGFIITDFYSGDSSKIVEQLSFNDGSMFDLTTLLVLPNQAPEAQNDNFTVNEDTVITGNLLVDNGSGEDADIDGDTLAVQAATIVTAVGATVIINTDGTFEYTPALNVFGSDSFEYTVTDGELTDAATASINVLPINDAPVAVDDNETTNEDTAVTITVLSNDSDIDLDTLSVASVGIATNGMVVLNGDNTITYTPNSGFSDTDSFSYTVSDGQDGTDTALVEITINTTLVYNKITGTNSNNTIKGTTESDLIYGFGGDDTLYGEDENDYLDGGEGDDILKGGNGDDLINGDNGADRLYGWTGNDILNGDNGQDYLRGGNDDDYLYGGDDNDTLYGEDGDDYLDGGEGDDILKGGNGHDTLYGSAGNDTLYGEDGNDTLNGGDGDDILKGKEGDDLINGDNGADRLYGEDGNDILNGHNGQDYLRGGNDDDTLYGGDDNDYLSGDAGNDYLYGGAGHDDLRGYDGNDILFAGAGNDRLAGYDGADTFAFSGTEILDGNLNRVVDFNVLEGDIISFRDVLEEYDPITDAISDFISLKETDHTYIKIDRDGIGTEYVSEYVVRIENLSGQWTDVDDMITQGHLEMM